MCPPWQIVSAIRHFEACLPSGQQFSVIYRWQSSVQQVCSIWVNSLCYMVSTIRVRFACHLDNKCPPAKSIADLRCNHIYMYIYIYTRHRLHGRTRKTDYIVIGRGALHSSRIIGDLLVWANKAKHTIWRATFSIYLINALGAKTFPKLDRVRTPRLINMCIWTLMFYAHWLRHWLSLSARAKQYRARTWSKHRAVYQYTSQSNRSGSFSWVYVERLAWDWA
jgi:hypothetical protein